jgi:hypothetical protein
MSDCEAGLSAYFLLLNSDSVVYPALGEKFMWSKSSGNQTSNPVARILLWALSVGGVSLAAGWFGPALFSTANLGPLLGIFVTGPLGTLAGALVGALRGAKESARTSIYCIGLVWVMTQLYIFLGFGLSARVPIYAIPLQFLVVASGIFLLSGRDTRAQLPDGIRRCGAIAVAAQATILLMTVYLPVIKPWWIPAGQQPGTTAPLPSFAFILDGRFDAGRQFPLFAVNRGALAWEWIITVVFAIGLCLLLRALRPRHTV